MNLLQYINKIFCALLVFAGVNESYSQREIHPLEPMFTYEYALKYYLNKPVIDFVKNEFDGEFWMIENFKAPSGVKCIDQQYFRNYLYSGKDLIFNNTEDDQKYHYIYDSETGFLVKSGMYKNETIKKNKPELINIKELTYSYDDKFTKIEVCSFINKSPSNKIYRKYFYDNTNQNLIKMILNQKDTIHFSYQNDSIRLINEIKVGKSIYKIEHKFTKLPSQNNFNINNVKRYLPKKKYATTYSLNYNILFEDTRKSLNGYLEFNKYFIYSSTPDIRMLFNRHQQLIEYHESTNRFRRPESPLLRHNLELKDYSISEIDRSVIKKGTKKWYEFLNVNKYSGKYFKQRQSKENIYNIKNGNIYLDGLPVIILNNSK